MRQLKNCECRGCGHKWQDFPGVWAGLSKLGCPKCGGLYWTETAVEE